MKTKPLHGIRAIVMSRTLLPMAIFGIVLFFPCLYLSIAFSSNIAIGGCVAALLLPAFIGAQIQKRLLAQIPCPDCGRRSMTRQNDSKDQQILICTDCHVAWRTDLSNHVSS